MSSRIRAQGIDPPPVELPERFNMAAPFLDRHFQERRGPQTAMQCEGRTFTYAETLEMVNRAGNGLRNMGLEKGDRLLLILPDGPEFVAAYFGAVKIGAVAVPTNPGLRASDYAYFLDESEAAAAIVHASAWQQVEPALEDRAHLREIVVAGEPKTGRLFWDDWLSSQPAQLEAAPTNKDEIAFWLWTSGSTGPPKAALHRHRDWIYCCRYYAQGVLGITPQDLTFSSSKLYHAYGLGNSLLFPFHAGATTVLSAAHPSASQLLRQAQQFRPTLFFSVPTFYAAMLQETDRDNSYDLSSVRLAVSAAEPLPAGIYHRWRERFGSEILDGVGSTEALHIYISSRPGQSKPGSAGRPVAGYHLRITGEQGDLVPQGEVGDLWVKGDSIAPGYWNRPELSRQRMQGEWFFTGDKFFQDADGYLWYAGRADDMFRVSGQWVSPIEVENTLIEHPAVLESAVVPYQDENRLLKPKAYVVLKPGQTEGEELARELQAFVKARISPYKYPRRIEFTASLPKTSTGKIQRFQLRLPENPA